MLVLSRKPGETIYLGTNITLTVLNVKGCRVSLGIEAPHQVAILRAELVGIPPGGADPEDRPGEFPGRCTPRR